MVCSIGNKQDATSVNCDSLRVLKLRRCRWSISKSVRAVTCHCRNNPLRVACLVQLRAQAPDAVVTAICDVDGIIRADSKAGRILETGL
jgi:hypothetical protein